MWGLGRLEKLWVYRASGGTGGMEGTQREKRESARSEVQAVCCAVTGGLWSWGGLSSASCSRRV